MLANERNELSHFLTIGQSQRFLFQNITKCIKFFLGIHQLKKKQVKTFIWWTQTGSGKVSPTWCTSALYIFKISAVFLSLLSLEAKCS